MEDLKLVIQSVVASSNGVSKDFSEQLKSISREDIRKVTEAMDFQKDHLPANFKKVVAHTNATRKRNCTHGILLNRHTIQSGIFLESCSTHFTEVMMNDDVDDLPKIDGGGGATMMDMVRQNMFKFLQLCKIHDKKYGKNKRIRINESHASIYLSGALVSVLEQKLTLARNYAVFYLLLTAWVKVGGDFVEATLLAHYYNGSNNGAAMESPKPPPPPKAAAAVAGDYDTASIWDTYFGEPMKKLETDRTMIRWINKQVPCNCLDRLSKAMKKSPSMGRCKHCLLEFEKDQLKTCSKCLQVSYCSRTCQVEHWKTVHKQVCIPIRPTKEEMESMYVRSCSEDTS